MKKAIAFFVCGSLYVLCLWGYMKITTFIPKVLGHPKDWDAKNFSQQIIELVLLLLFVAMFYGIINLIARLYVGLTTYKRRHQSSKRYAESNPTALFIQNENL